MLKKEKKVNFTALAPEKAPAAGRNRLTSFKSVKQTWRREEETFPKT